MSQTLEALEFVTGPEPTASIIVLHGLGADGNDFVPVAQMLDLGVPVRFIFRMHHRCPSPSTTAM